MFTEKMIRNAIKVYIDSGISKFVIYPFGSNGMLVNNCMEQCFGISPVMIVDNGYSQYNAKIANIDEFRQVYEDDVYVILTVENEELNFKLKEGLLSFVPPDRIVNLYDLAYKERVKIREFEIFNQVGNRFSLEEILPQRKQVLRNGVSVEKIKVRFMHSEVNSWNCMKTICEQFEKDDRFDVLVITGGKTEDNIYKLNRLKEQMKQEHHQYVLGNEYCVEEDKADILIIYSSLAAYKWDLKAIREHTKLIFSVPLAIQRYTPSIEMDWKISIECEMYKPDFYLIDSLLFNEVKNTRFYSDKVVEMGNAKFDVIFNASKQKKYPVGWEKLKGKKTVLWATTHGIYNGKVSEFITFDLYAKAIFQYAKQHADMGLVVRLHGGFIGELLNGGYWTDEDLVDIKKYCADSPNIIWDETDTYDATYSVTDAILTDVFCGIAISALPTLKPICVMYRNDREISPYNKEYVEKHYSVHSEKDLADFFDMVLEGKDPMLEQRREISKRCVKHFDGKNGERIKNFIVQAYDAEVQELQ